MERGNVMAADDDHGCEESAACWLGFVLWSRFCLSISNYFVFFMYQIFFVLKYDYLLIGAN